MDKGMVAKREWLMGTDEPNGVRPVWVRPPCDGLTARRRWKSLLVAVILFVGFVVGERPAFCFSLDRFQLWSGCFFKPEAPLRSSARSQIGSAVSSGASLALRFSPPTQRKRRARRLRVTLAFVSGSLRLWILPRQPNRAAILRLPAAPSWCGQAHLFASVLPARPQT